MKCSRCKHDRPDLSDEHGTAALCLHDQPFGFTREDARRHRREADRLREYMDQPCQTKELFGGGVLLVDDPGETMRKGDLLAWHESMADRIEALLPPEGP